MTDLQGSALVVLAVLLAGCGGANETPSTRGPVYDSSDEIAVRPACDSDGNSISSCSAGTVCYESAREAMMWSENGRVVIDADSNPNRECWEYR